LFAALAACLLGGTSALAQTAYVAQEVSNQVGVYDLASNTLVAKIPVGTNPIGAAVSPDGTRVYVSNGA